MDERKCQIVVDERKYCKVTVVSNRDPVCAGLFVTELKSRLTSLNLQYEEKEYQDRVILEIHEGKIGVLQINKPKASEDSKIMGVDLKYPETFDETIAEEEWKHLYREFTDNNYSKYILLVSNFLQKRRTAYMSTLKVLDEKVTKVEETEGAVEETVKETVGAREPKVIVPSKVKQERGKKPKKTTEKHQKRSREELEKERKQREKEARAKKRKDLIKAQRAQEAERLAKEADLKAKRVSKITKVTRKLPSEKNSNVLLIDDKFGNKKASVQFSGLDAKDFIFFVADSLLICTKNEDFIKENEDNIIIQLKNILIYIKISNVGGNCLSLEEKNNLISAVKILSERLELTALIDECDSLVKSAKRNFTSYDFAKILTHRLKDNSINVVYVDSKVSNSAYLTLDWGMLGGIRVSDHASKKVGWNQSVILYADEYKIEEDVNNGGSPIINYYVPLDYDYSEVINKIVDVVLKERHRKQLILGEGNYKSKVSKERNQYYSRKNK